MQHLNHLTRMVLLILGILLMPTQIVEAKEDGLSKSQKAFIDNHIEWAIELGDKVAEEHEGRKPATVDVLAQAAYESGWGQSNFCLDNCNDFGIGGRDRPKSFGSHYESWEFYYDLVARDMYTSHGSLDADETYDYIYALVEGGYCSDYGYTREVVKIANKIRTYTTKREKKLREEEGFSLSSEERLTEAEMDRVREMALKSLDALSGKVS